MKMLKFSFFKTILRILKEKVNFLQNYILDKPLNPNTKIMPNKTVPVEFVLNVNVSPDADAQDVSQTNADALAAVFNSGQVVLEFPDEVAPIQANVKSLYQAKGVDPNDFPSVPQAISDLVDNDPQAAKDLLMQIGGAIFNP